MKSVRLDRCVTFEESPDDGIYMRRLTPADVLELARSLEGAEVVDAEWFGQSYADYCVPVGNTGPFLVIPLPEGEE